MVRNSNSSFWERQSQTIFITGGETALGRRVIDRLAHSGWVIRMLVSSLEKVPTNLSKRVFPVEGSLASVSDLCAAIQDCSKVIHLHECSCSRNAEGYREQNIEFTRNLVQACKQNGISQFVLISSSAVDLRKLTHYGKSKKVAEDVLRGSGLPWVILRPTLIVGQEGGETYRWLRMAVRRLSWIPMPEGGHAICRPIHEDDFVRAIDQLIQSNPASVLRKMYHISGAKAYTSAELIDLIAQEHHLPRRNIIGLPTWACKIIAKFGDVLLHVPFEISEALASVVQDSDPGHENAFLDFHYQPSPLEGRLSHSNQWHQAQAKQTASPFLRVTQGLSIIRSKQK